MSDKNKKFNNSSSDYYTTNTTDDDNMLTRSEDDRKSHDTDRNSSDMFYRFLERFLEIIFLIIEYIIYNAIPILVSALLIIILIGCIFYVKNIAIGIGILLIFNFIGFRNLGYFRNPNEYK